MGGKAIPRFGSTDCGCESHLFRFDTDPMKRGHFWIYYFYSDIEIPRALTKEDGRRKSTGSGCLWSRRQAAFCKYFVIDLGLF
jgi:hypothetical protein